MFLPDELGEGARPHTLRERRALEGRRLGRVVAKQTSCIPAVHGAQRMYNYRRKELNTRPPNSSNAAFSGNRFLTRSAHFYGQKLHNLRGNATLGFCVYLAAAKGRPSKAGSDWRVDDERREGCFKSR